MKSAGIIIGIVIVLGAVGILVFGGSEDEPTNSNSVTTNTQTQQNDTQPLETNLSDGETPAQSIARRYVDYSKDALAQSETDKNLIFFHAAWCTVCNAVERNIEAGTIPSDVTIFKVNYDSDEGQELADKYKIPIQYSTVQVDTAGNELTKWVNQFTDDVNDFVSRTVST